MALPRQELDADIQLAARGDMSVLLTGEPGAGKQYVARLVHGWSRRSEAPLVTMRCAGLPDAALELELFGRGEGHLPEPTGDTTCRLERAEGGSLLLEEVGEISPHMQGRLLRFLDSRLLERSRRPPQIVDVRMMATATQPLFERVVAGRFIEDLYYRLNVIHLRIPPLRDRREELPSLTAKILRNLAERHRISVPELAPAVIASLQAYDWPGNVRELRDVMESLLVSRHAAIVESKDLPAWIVGQSLPGTQTAERGRAGAGHGTLTPSRNTAEA